jgi:hypothetical protein
MLRFNVELCRIGSNVVHKVRRYIHFFVASESISDVEGFIPEGTYVVSTNNRLIGLGRISAFLPLSSLKGIERRLSMKERHPFSV